MREPRPRHAEAVCECPASPPRREPDRCEVGAIADEGIPGRLRFDLYLLKSNQQQREADRRSGGAVSGCRDDSSAREAARGLRKCASAARIAEASPIGSLNMPGSHTEASGPAGRPTARIALVAVAATRRGSILDVLA